MALIDKLNAIGDAIREKTGKTDKMTLDGMVNEITELQIDNGYSERLNKIIDRTMVTFEVPEAVTTIGNYAFCDCRKLAEVNIPETVTTIAYRSFYNCIALTSITLPASLKTMNGGQTFTSSSNLTTVRLLGSAPPTIAANTFPDTVTTFIVPKGAKSTYTSASNWSALASKIVEES